MAINNYPNGTVCLKCDFIPGINNFGFFINFACSQSGLNRNITANLIDCQHNFVSNLYHIYVYDLESDGTPFIEQPAFTTSAMIMITSSPTPSLTDFNTTKGLYNFVAIIVFIIHVKFH